MDLTFFSLNLLTGQSKANMECVKFCYLNAETVANYFYFMNLVFQPKSLSCDFDSHIVFTLLKIPQWCGPIAPNPGKSNLIQQSKKTEELMKTVVCLFLNQLATVNIPETFLSLRPGSVSHNTSHFCQCKDLTASGFTVWWEGTLLMKWCFFSKIKIITLFASDRAAKMEISHQLPFYPWVLHIFCLSDLTICLVLKLLYKKLGQFLLGAPESGNDYRVITLL